MEHILTGDIGGRLRRAREDRGLSLSDVARLTKLSINVLHAIERNDFTSLPGGMYRRAYVHTLAAEVGLNPNQIAADYCKRFEPLVETLPVPDRGPTLQERWVQQLTPSPQRSLVSLAALIAPALAWFVLQSGPVSHGASPALTADPPRRAVTATAVAEATAAPLRIEMAATGWCWVAAETDGERVMYRLVEPGERVVLEGQRLIALRLGDAGAVMLSINDGPSRSFGGDGQVVELEVTPDNVAGLREA